MVYTAYYILSCLDRCIIHCGYIVAPVLAVRTDVVADASQCRSRGKVVVMRSRGEGHL